MTFTHTTIRTPAYDRGDADQWESDDGRYRIVQVYRAWGVCMPTHVHAIVRTLDGERHLCPERNLRSFKVAVRLCKRHARANKIVGQLSMF